MFHDLEGKVVARDETEFLSQKIEFNNALANFMGYYVHKYTDNILNETSFTYTEIPLPENLKDENEKIGAYNFIEKNKKDWNPAENLEHLFLCEQKLMERGGYMKSSVKKTIIDERLEQERNEVRSPKNSVVILKYSKSQTYNGLFVIAHNKNKFEAIKDACMVFEEKEKYLRKKNILNM